VLTLTSFLQHLCNKFSWFAVLNPPDLVQRRTGFVRGTRRQQAELGVLLLVKVLAVPISGTCCGEGAQRWLNLRSRPCMQQQHQRHVT
jgi:hypothetical protein